MNSIVRSTGSKLVREGLRYVGGSAKPKTLCPRPAPEVPPNPCVPRDEGGHKGSYKKYQYILFFVMFPLIVIQSLRAFSHDDLAEEQCRDFEYMRVRTKRFPWGDGTETLFHNPEVNKLPGECSREQSSPHTECDE